MVVKRPLHSEERDFFTLVSRAAFANPFGDERSEIDLQISGLHTWASQEDRISAVVNEVSRRTGDLERDGIADINLYYGDDRNMIEKVFLFEMFYQFKDRYDQLIADQTAAGDSPVKIPFYSEAFAAISKRGFNEELFKRYFALGFQIRRAYYFIDRSMVGNSACMKALRSNLWNNVFTHNIEMYNRYLLNRMEDFSTLLLGETGTGKGTAASAIGRSGFIPLDRRKRCFEESFTRSFVSINLSQFPETLIESALFGHKKGAFTGAIDDYQGVFERCSPYGAILLDEIGEVSKPIQIKLLQVLQERIFTPVGSQKKSRFNGRVIAATNRPVVEIRGRGLFRDDFYYRLSSDIIVVPPLRQRISEDPGELDVLLEKTIERLIGKPSYELVGIVRDVIEKQLGANYPWPGNVRELEQCVRRVMLKGLYTGEKGSDGLDVCRHLVDGVEQGDIDAYNLISGYCYLLYQRHRTFEEVARRTGLDRRTVKKYIQAWDSGSDITEDTLQDPVEDAD
ncbi:MAG: sigma 54-interacting transcriptional regulator [Desulfobacterales bacterium]|nr:sigma 54-interacting transcriptional regulator [Desulfobacterales bacterium]